MSPEQMIEELRGIDRKAQRYSSIEVWRAIADMLYEGFTDNFARSAEADGTPWQPRKSKVAMNPLLILTSLLIRSVGGQGHSIFDAQPYALTLGVDGGNVKYAAIHNDGSNDGWMPQREYLNVPEALRNQAAEKFIDSFTAHLFPTS